MKKFLFLILSLAVSASAVAGVMNTKPVSKFQLSNRATKNVTHKAKMDAPAPAAIMKVIQKEQQVVGNIDVRSGEKTKLRTGNIITEQPQGTVVTYKRTSGQSVHRYYDSSASSPWGGLTFTQHDGTEDITAVENGSKIYFKNLLYDPDGYFDDYWIEGTKSSNGNRVTINLRQELLNYSDGSSIILVMGTLTYNNGFTWEESEVATATFTVSGDVLTLQNSAYDGNYGGTCLGADWDDGYGWAGFADFATVLTRGEELDIEIPDYYTDDDIIAMAEQGGDLYAYGRTGDAIVVSGSSLYLDEQSGVTYVYFAEDGTVYMRDPVYDFEAGFWAKGTLNGNTITIPLNQYVYWDDEYYGMRLTWGEFKNGAGGYTAMPEVTECTYTINEDNIVLNGTQEYVQGDTADCYIGLSLTLEQNLVEKGWYGCLNWNTIYWNAPDMPENVTADPAATTAKITWDGGETEEWNLRYRQYNPNGESYFCDFEDGASGWVNADMDQDGYAWSSWTPSYDGGKCYTSASYNSAGALTPDNWLISPEVALNGVCRFVAWGQDPSWAGEVFAVYVTTNPDYESTDDFVMLSDGDITAKALADSVNLTENTYIFDLSEYAGQRGCIAIRHYNITDMFRLNVDDFYVGDPDAPVYPWITVEGITEIPYTIEGLTPETTYEVQVAGVNGGAIGVWTESTVFTTLAEQAGLRGDVDDNGVVNIQDVTCLINHLLTQQWDDVPGQFSLDNADCDLNGTPNIQDVTSLINYLLSHVWPE